MSAAEWRIRPAQADDGEFVRDLAPRLASGFPLPDWRAPGEIVDAERATLAEALSAIAHDKGRTDQALMIAKGAQGERGGFVYVQQQVDYFRKAASAHIAIIVVGAEQEGRGAGRALLDAAELWAHQRGLTMITLHVFAENQRARQLYERQGYRPEYVRYVKPL